MEDWESFVDQIKETIERNPDMDEANTKNRIINPLLEKLGWEAIKGQVVAEYSIKFATSTSHVDFALLVEGSPVVFVEAKALRSKIKPDNARQILDYGRHKDVNWCVLTNGKELRIYNSEWFNPESGDTSQALVEVVPIEDYVEKKDIISRISRRSVESGDTRQTFKRIKHTKDTVNNLKDNRPDIESNIENILNDYVRELVKDKVSQATTSFINELINELSDYTRTSPKQSPEPKEEELPTIRRDELLNEYPSGSVMVTPSSPELVDEETGLPSGVGFFKEYSAWGFVRIGATRDIDYLALYVTSPESQVKYFGKVTSIVNPKDPESPVREHVQQKEGLASWNLEEGKKVILLEKDSLVELENPIELGTVPKGVLQGSWYTSLQKFAQAEVTDDLKG